MPHIDEDGRRFLNKEVDALIVKLQDPSISGEDKNEYINYAINRIVWKSVGLDKQEKHWKYNDAIGIFECAKLEMYTMMCRAYEQIKVEENGSAYKD